MGNKLIVKDFESDSNFDPTKLFKWRIKWLKRTIAKYKQSGRQISKEQNLKWYKDEKKVYMNNLKDSIKIDKLSKDIGIIVPAHVGNVKFLRACLESCNATGYFTILSFDNPFHQKSMQVENRMPSSEALYYVDFTLMKHKSWASGVGIPHVWNMIYGIKLLDSLGFKYVFNINGDCMMEKPENFPILIEKLGNNDIISCEYIPDKKYLGTMGWLTKTKIALDFWEDYVKNMYKFNIGNAEARMGKFYIDNKYKVSPVENPWEAHFKPFPNKDQKADWYKWIGFRHLHAEHKVRKTLKMEPIEKKHFDFGRNNIFMSGHEQKTLMKYWETGDQKFLKSWWG